MSLSTIAKRLLNADLQAQYKAGYINEELKLTDAGKLVLLQEFYFNGGSELLTKRAQAKIDEEAKNA